MDGDGKNGQDVFDLGAGAPTSAPAPAPEAGPAALDQQVSALFNRASLKGAIEAAPVMRRDDPLAVGEPVSMSRYVANLERQLASALENRDRWEKLSQVRLKLIEDGAEALRKATLERADLREANTRLANRVEYLEQQTRNSSREELNRLRSENDGLTAKVRELEHDLDQARREATFAAAHKVESHLADMRAMADVVVNVVDRAMEAVEARAALA